MNWEMRVRRGEQAPNASTDASTAAQIKKDREQGLTYRQLAEKHHVSESTVQRILLYGAYGG